MYRRVSLGFQQRWEGQTERSCEKLLSGLSKTSQMVGAALSYEKKILEAGAL